jgi:hypothetical protein
MSNDVKDKEQFQVKIPTRFIALENFDDDDDDDDDDNDDYNQEGIIEDMKASAT